MLFSVGIHRGVYPSSILKPKYSRNSSTSMHELDTRLFTIKCTWLVIPVLRLGQVPMSSQVEFFKTWLPKAYLDIPRDLGFGGADSC